MRINSNIIKQIRISFQVGFFYTPKYILIKNEAISNVEKTRSRFVFFIFSPELSKYNSKCGIWKWKSGLVPFIKLITHQDKYLPEAILPVLTLCIWIYCIYKYIHCKYKYIYVRSNTNTRQFILSQMASSCNHWTHNTKTNFPTNIMYESVILM